MKYIDEYRDPSLARGLLDGIARLSEQIGRTITVMEVCGSHTNAIGRFGIRNLIPETIRLISGPGCPVCVTAIHDVDIALHLAAREDVIFSTFGDMLRVPGSHGNSLQNMHAGGADIRVVASAADCISLARTHTDREIVFMGIGFETTAPTIAATILSCRGKGVSNFSVFSVHKIVPPVLKALITDPALNVDAFLCPGHVSTIIGANAYELITRAGRAAVITGFEPIDILEGIFMLLEQIAHDKKRVAIQYSRGVKPEGNPRARDVMMAVFRPGDAEWRGLGTIPGSGLLIREDYETFDALKKFEVPEIHSVEMKGCCCGDILRGVKMPNQCPLFKQVCTPVNPGGPCMVSSEGTCATYYKYN